jgi:hypothetical protein
MTRPVRLALTLVVSALTMLAFTGLAAAQEAGDDQYADSTTESQAGDGSGVAEEEAGSIDDGTGDFEVMENERAGAGDDSEAAQEDDGATEDESSSDGGDAAQADDVDRDCDDFDTEAEAQEYFDEQGGDETHNVDDLDLDGDGQACESLGAPSGGVDAGGGGTATPPTVSSSDPLPFAVGGGALGLMLGGAALLMRRRRVTA